MRDNNARRTPIATLDQQCELLHTRNSSFLLRSDISTEFATAAGSGSVMQRGRIRPCVAVGKTTVAPNLLARADEVIK
jgi:hypothetical protein